MTCFKLALLALFLVNLAFGEEGINEKKEGINEKNVLVLNKVNFIEF